MKIYQNSSLFLLQLAHNKKGAALHFITCVIPRNILYFSCKRCCWYHDLSMVLGYEGSSRSKKVEIILFPWLFPCSQLRSFAISLFVFLPTKNNTTLSPGFLGQQVRKTLVNSSIGNLQWAALWMSFWRHCFNVTKFSPNLVNSDWLWWINQSETEK